MCLKTLTSTQKASRNSFTPGEIWPDASGLHINAHGGGFIHHECVYYWFGEHKVEGDAGNRAEVGVGVYSSRDLYNWQNEGIALSVSDDPKSDIARGCILERPKVIYNAKSKQFVMWFHLELAGQGYSAARVGIATSDHVTGPYRFLRSLRPNAGRWPLNVGAEEKYPPSEEDAARLGELSRPEGPKVREVIQLLNRRDHVGGQMSRDMTLFVDDDGTAYHVAASEENATLNISRLTDDFLSTTGEYIRVFPGRFHEAPAIFKAAGRYYMISSDCTGWVPNAARLSTAPKMFGPWTEIGNPCVGEKLAVDTTFESQSTYVIPVAGIPNAFIFAADRWRPDNAIDGRYVWLPMQFDDSGVPFLRWHRSWGLAVFSSGDENCR